MTEDEHRERVVAEANDWLGTPWRHYGRVKHVGVDCAMFPLMVYSACGLIFPLDPGPYPKDWHIHRGVERYLTIVQQIADEIDEADEKPGDLRLYKIGQVFSHGVIVLDHAAGHGIHALVGHGVCYVDMNNEAGFITSSHRSFSLREWPDGR